MYLYICIFNKNDINMYFLHLLAFMFAKHWNIPVFCQQRLENCVNNDVVVICHCCIQCKNNIFKNMFLAMVKPILQNYIKKKKTHNVFLHLEIGCTIQQKKTYQVLIEDTVDDTLHIIERSLVSWTEISFLGACFWRVQSVQVNHPSLVALQIGNLEKSVIFWKSYST